MRLIEEYRRMHAARLYPGTSILPWGPSIGHLVRRSGAVTLLDYGCGAGEQYTVHKLHKRWGVRPVLYDPAVCGLDRKPESRFDGVICTDVLEHVPEDDLLAVVADLAGFARHWCFVTVCCRPAKKSFADGTNVHVTIRPFGWWQKRLGAFFAGSGARLVLRETK
jgi:2-polyprenyl-3-methyl-5-hydroxy-6-metoxy-1,4-benzoquinol methylase